MKRVHLLCIPLVVHREMTVFTESGFCDTMQSDGLPVTLLDWQNVSMRYNVKLRVTGYAFAVGCLPQGFKSACLRQFAGEDRGVESALVDQYRRGSIDGERFVHRLVLMVYMVADGLLWIPATPDRQAYPLVVGTSALNQGSGFVFLINMCC